LIKFQNRDGLPASIAEEQRFFELHSFDKTATPARWNTPANWKTLDEIPEGRPFGYAVGNNSTKLLVDYDHVVNNGKVTPWIKDVVLRLRKVCATYFETSMSGTGYHQIVDLSDYADSFAPESNGYNNIIVDMPIDEYRALSKEERDKVPKIEFWFKVEGRYCFLTGEHKVFNEVAKDEEAAAFFRELLLIRQEMREKHNSAGQNSNFQNTGLQGVRFDTDEATRQRVLEALPYISADCSRDEWIHCGIALHHCGFDLEVWDTWSRFKDQRTGEASDKYVEGETEKIWRSFENNQSHWNAGTIISMAKKNGYIVKRNGPNYNARNLVLEENKADTPKQTTPAALPELTEQEAITLSSNESGPIPFITNMDGSMSKSSFTNYVLALQRDAYINKRIRFNAFDGRITFAGFFWDAKPHPARDADIANLRYYVDNLYSLNNKQNLLEACTKVAVDNPFHPVREYLSRLKWDGVPRIGELLPRYLGAERCEYTTAVTTLMFYGAIQRVMNPGCKFDYCIILQDTNQGTGKSTLCRFLALNDEWFSDSVGNLNDSKSVFELMRGKWIIELGEMLAVRRAQDVETIKAFISRQSQDYRQPYGTFAENHPRQCIFIGTSNKPQFLPEDKTGNRRFVPVICNGKKAAAHPLDNEAETRAFIEQCYAEALTTGAAEGYPLVLDAKLSDELLKIQEAATPEDTWIGMIQEYLDGTDLTMVCTRLIWDSVFAGDNEREPKRYELNDIAEILELHIDGWERYKGKDGSNGRAKYKFKVYGTQNAWQKTGGKRKERFLDADLTQHKGLAGLPAMTKEELLRQDEKVASGVASAVASGVASLDAIGFEGVDDDENLPFD
jgi:predicted P-loop ATPase